MAKPARSTAVVPATAKQVTLPTNVNEMFANEVAQVAARIHQPTGNWIRVEGKEFVLPDARRLTSIDAVIVDFIAANNYYDTDYQEGVTTPAACFSLNFNPHEMAPSKNIAEPVNDVCATCPNKAWGSHRNGRGGKACDDNRNYVVMEVQPDGTTKLYMMKASKTAVKAFDAYVNNIASTYVRPLRGVMTRISFDPTSKFPSQRWECLGPAELGQIELAQANLDEARRMLSVEPQIAANDADGGTAQPAAKAKPAAKKAVARK
jgi:hypothetical protein